MKMMIKIGEKEFVNGDIYYNPFFGDLWIIQNDTKIKKINDSYITDIDDVAEFVYVGHIDLE
jgi:hypothetical protein